MITVEGRSLIISNADGTVGCFGDNLVESRQFSLPLSYGGVDLSALTWVIETTSGSTKNIISLDASAGERLVLSWTIKASHFPASGLVEIQLRGYAGAETTDPKWHSNIAYVYVSDSINASGSIPDPIPSEFAQMEERIVAAKDTAVEAAASAEDTLAEINAITAVTIGNTEPDNGLWIKELI